MSRVPDGNSPGPGTSACGAPVAAELPRQPGWERWAPSVPSVPALRDPAPAPAGAGTESSRIHLLRALTVPGPSALSCCGPLHSRGTGTNLKPACQTLWLLCHQPQRPKVTLKYIQRNKKPPGIYTSLKQHKALLQTGIVPMLRSCEFTNRIHLPCVWMHCVKSEFYKVLMTIQKSKINTEARKDFQDHSNCIYLKQLLSSSSA